MQLRQSKINHSVLQKRYREDDISDIMQDKNPENFNEGAEQQVNEFSIQRTGDKRRLVEHA